MKTTTCRWFVLALMLAAWAWCLPAGAQVPSLINYQGRLLNGTNLVNGNVGLSLRLYSASAGGSKLYEDSNTVAVVDGLYSTFIGDQTNSGNFAAALTNAQVWVEAAVNGVALAPRERLASVAFALRANEAENFSPALASNTFWRLGGNSGTTPGAQFLGTSDNQPLELKANGRRALRLEPDPVNDAPNLIAGSSSNTVAPGIAGAVIAGGGRDVAPNRVLGDFGAVGGGQGNAASNLYDTVSGGLGNTAAGGYGTVGGGSGNLARDLPLGRATVAGGMDNRAAGSAATVGGGRDNASTNTYATVPGGRNNTAGGADSFAAGRRAKANHPGAFVWADSTDADFASTTANQFRVRATGGVSVDTGTGPGLVLNTANRPLITRAYDPFASGPHAGAGRWGVFMEGNTLALGMPAIADKEVQVLKYYADGTNTWLVRVDQSGNLYTRGGVTAAGFSGSGAGLTGLNAAQLTSSVPDAALSNVWKLNGNAGTVAGTHFLGTTDNQPVEIRAGGLRAVLITPSNGAPNIVLGATENVISDGTWGASILGGSMNTIAAEATFSVVAGGELNDIGANSKHSAIGGGYDNDVAGNSQYTTIAGGFWNDIGPNSAHSAIGGGYHNDVADGSEYATIAGGWDNNVAEYSQYVTIAGGGGNDIGTNSDYSAIGGGENNNVGDDSGSAAIGGGKNNSVDGGSQSATIAGGENNSVSDRSEYATIAGGISNTISVNAPFSSIGGGATNTIEDGAGGATIAGGRMNLIESVSVAATIGGGQQNLIEGENYYSIICGGYANTIGDNHHSTLSANVIGGGSTNRIGSQSQFATIPGGRDNAVGDYADYAFAAGRRAKANQEGTFVWADSQDADFVSTGSNQFLIRAKGGVGINAANPSQALQVDSGDVLVRGTNNFAAGSDARVILGDGNNYVRALWGQGLRFGVFLGADSLVLQNGGTVGIGRVPTANRLEVEGDASKTIAGAFAANSDARIKTDVQSLTNALEVIGRLRPVAFHYTDDYRAKHPSIEDKSYLNFIAQEYREVFPDFVKDSGEDGILQIDTHPAMIYAVAAIQELRQQNAALLKRVEELERRTGD